MRNIMAMRILTPIVDRIGHSEESSFTHQLGGRMAIKNWDTKTSRILYRRFEAGESLIEGLESLALSEGIREATVTSCIGSLSQLKLRNLCDRKEGVPGLRGKQSTRISS